jgi:CheY-like chemotaxis protein
MSNYVMLLVEDDALQREVLAELLKDEGFEVVEWPAGLCKRCHNLGNVAEDAKAT